MHRRRVLEGDVGPRKVIHVITRLDHGGSAQNTLLTALGHNRARFAPLVVAGAPGRWDAQGGAAATESNGRRLEEAAVGWRLITSLTRAVSPIKDLMALIQLTALFRQERPLVVHTHTSKAGVLGRIAGRLVGVPALVHTPHGHVFYGHFGPLRSWAFLQTERLLARWTTRLIALTEAERDEHLHRLVGRPDRFAVIPSGIDVDRFRSLVGVTGQRPAGCDWPQDALVVGSIGWLTPVKGHRVLVEAIGALKSSFPRLHLFIVGSGSLRGELTALAGQLGIGKSVTFAGERADVPECLAAMDLYVQPSLNEGMGRALVEAMAAGRPAVATSVGGVPTLIEHRRNGLLVPPGNKLALAEAIAELLQHPSWAKELGTAASASIGRRFQATDMVQAVEAVYEEALREVGRA